MAFLNPPGLKTKTWYINLDTLVSWGLQTRAYLDAPGDAREPPVDRQKRQEKLGWLRSYRPALKRWSELLAVARAAEKMVQAGIHASIGAQLQSQLQPLATTPAARRIRDQVLAFLADQSAGMSPGQRLIGTTEVLESIFGKYKRVQSCHSQGGMTSMLLSIGAMIGKQTPSVIKQALEAVRSADVDTWCSNHLGITLQAQRRRALAATQTG